LHRKQTQAGDGAQNNHAANDGISHIGKLAAKIRPGFVGVC
jgi:hypothetical protein